MKRTRSILILLLALSSGFCLAQSAGVEASREAKRRVVPGIKAGINRSNVYDAQGEGFVADPKTGFAGGFFIALPIGGLLGIQPEVLISQKGFSSEGRMFGEIYYLDRTTTYLDIPLQVQLKPVHFFTLLAGVQYSYLLRQTDSFTHGVNTTAQSQAFANDNIRKNIFGAVCGVDFNIRHIVLSGRACWDLRANQGSGYYTPRYKNIWFQATIGYRLY